MKFYKDMNHKEKANECFEAAAWQYLYGTAGYVELFLKQANYHLARNQK